MSVETHLSHLQQRHESLEKEIHKENNHKFPNEMVITHLKKKKLQLREEIERLKQA